MKVEMLKTRDVGNFGLREQGKQYDFPKKVGEQLIAQGIAKLPEKPKKSELKTGDK